MSAAATVQPSAPAPIDASESTIATVAASSTDASTAPQQPTNAHAPVAQATAASPMDAPAPGRQHGWHPTSALPTAPPAWQAQPQPARPMSGLAIATFVLGLCGFAILPVILGHIAIAMIRRSGQRGMAFAIVGTVLGYLAVAGYLALFAILGAGILAGTAGWI